MQQMQQVQQIYQQIQPVQVGPRCMVRGCKHPFWPGTPTKIKGVVYPRQFSDIYGLTCCQGASRHPERAPLL